MKNIFKEQPYIYIDQTSHKKNKYASTELLFVTENF